MATEHYTEEELNRYFGDARYRHGPTSGGNGVGGDGTSPPTHGYLGWLWRKLGDRQKVQAAFVLSVLTGLAVLGVVVLALTLTVLMVTGRTPSVEAIEDPSLNLATVAYTADGKELGRYGRQNRSAVSLDKISPHVVNALVATEDHRFRRHWGIDFLGIMAALTDIVRKADLRGASTITQQLARNLYNEQIGFEVSPTRKLKEMITAVQLERRYTKDEILEMYLNTVPFRHNAYGIEAAARTYFGKPASDLDPMQSAALIGMLKANTRYDPVRNPELSRQRRNIVMGQMVGRGFLDQSYYTTHADSLTPTDFRTADVTDSFAPYFAEHVRLWLNEWSEKSGHDIYAEGLVVYTTVDSRMQEMAQTAVAEQMDALQTVVDYEWSRRTGYFAGQELENFTSKTDYEPFAYFWESKQNLVRSFVRETPQFRRLRDEGVGADAALERLLADPAFMDSLRDEKTRLEAGLVSIDPRNGYVKAWVGGRDLKVDRYDHVAIARRQPGSTFKPFVYTAAIDNGYPPTYPLRDTVVVWRNPETGVVWRPGNVGGISGAWMSLREGLARSKNTITAQVITQLVNPSEVAFFARRMGVESPLDEVPALALGTSDVTLLEMTAAYSTLANGGLYYEPTVVTRIEDRAGNVLYEAELAPREALSEETAYTVVAMMRDVIDQGYGTGYRIRWQYKLNEYDFAGKTGTTQNSADGWFILMHPELVTGAWVGFNDRRIAFRSTFWGQGAHNALFLVGDYMTRLSKAPEVRPDPNEEFPTPDAFDTPEYDPVDPLEREPRGDRARDRVNW